ncbi:MAG TPA: SusD/RagB family nutrient-binding outer membrane lipoprotein [Puia sp.]|nr:SusD/RagB family nutrient-binding outer membrane lipoprotein [Puia sp.]
MYRQYKLVSCLAFCGLLALTACKKQLDTNLNDPNGKGINELTGKDVFAQALVSAVTNKVGGNISTAADNYDYAQQWLGYWARNTGWASSGAQQQMETFGLNNSFGDGIWASLYHNIYDFNYVMGNSTTGSVLPGASRAMRAMIFEDLVDQFGNIPYSQAGQPGLTLAPAYDSAATIYKDLIVQLDSAILSLQASQATTDDASDVMFKGNKTLWLEFANTIKLRILLRQVPHGDQAYVTTQVARIVTQGSGFLGAGQDALINPGFSDATQKQNPFWAVYGFQPGTTTGYQNNNFFTANNVMLNFLDSVGDVRKGYFFAKNSQGGIGGNFFGETLSGTAVTSAFGSGLLPSASAPALLFSASQSFFMQAEMVQRGLMTGNAATLYKQGVEESFRYLGVSGGAAAADAYISGSTNGMVNFTVSTNKLQTILYQKWIAECGLDGLEAWSDWRRTGYPFIEVPSYAAPGEPTPQRILYPESEYTQNGTNVLAQNQAPSDIYIPLFWAH